MRLPRGAIVTTMSSVFRVVESVYSRVRAAHHRTHALSIATRCHCRLLGQHDDVVARHRPMMAVAFRLRGVRQIVRFTDDGVLFQRSDGGNGETGDDNARDVFRKASSSGGDHGVLRDRRVCASHRKRGAAGVSAIPEASYAGMHKRARDPSIFLFDDGDNAGGDDRGGGARAHGYQW